jgi:hypothetical protein
MEMEQAVARVRQWSVQTITFALTIGDADKTKVPLEQTEVKTHRARLIGDQLYAEAITGLGPEPNGALVIKAVVKSTLNWVLANYKGTP